MARSDGVGLGVYAKQVPLLVWLYWIDRDPLNLSISFLLWLLSSRELYRYAVES